MVRGELTLTRSKFYLYPCRIFCTARRSGAFSKTLLLPDRDIRVDGTVALKSKREFVDDQANFDGSRIIARGGYGSMGVAGLANRAASASELIRRDPSRAGYGHGGGKHYDKNYNKHYNYKHYNYHHGGGKYYYRNRYWGHRYNSRPYNWQGLGCVVVGPVWYCP